MIFNKKLNMGMVGGGPGAFIGEVHRKAARMDGKVQLVAPPHTACIECTMSMRDYKNMWRRYSCSLEEISIIEKKMPALPTTTSIIAGIQIQEFIKAIHEIKGTGIGDMMGGKLWAYNGLNEVVDILHIKKRENCNVCGFFEY